MSIHLDCAIDLINNTDPHWTRNREAITDAKANSVKEFIHDCFKFRSTLMRIPFKEKLLQSRKNIIHFFLHLDFSIIEFALQLPPFFCFSLTFFGDLGDCIAFSNPLPDLGNQTPSTILIIRPTAREIFEFSNPPNHFAPHPNHRIATLINPLQDSLSDLKLGDVFTINPDTACEVDQDTIPDATSFEKRNQITLSRTQPRNRIAEQQEQVRRILKALPGQRPIHIKRNHERHGSMGKGNEVPMYAVEQ